MRKIVIIEDETLTARNLKNMLLKVAPEDKVVAMLQGVEDSVAWFQENHGYDLVFMDINLSDGSAFQIFDEVKVESPIIFTTAFNEYAIQAFKVNGVDYLLKPISEEDLSQSIERLNSMGALLNPKQKAEELDNVMPQLRSRMGEYMRHFLVFDKGKFVPICVDDIAYFSIDQKKVTATLFSGSVVTMENTMEELEGLLDPKDFYRANRQYLISHKAVSEASLWFGGRLELTLVVKTEEKIFISRTKVKEFKEWYSLN